MGTKGVTIKRCYCASQKQGRTINPQLIDRVDKLLVHLHRPDNPGLLCRVAAPFLVCVRRL